MLRRFSSTFKKSKGDREPKENGVQTNSKRHSKVPQVHRKSSSSDEDNSAKRTEVTGMFEKYAQLLHASQRPLPNQTGDGTYLEHESSTGLFQDLKTMGFKDFGTLKDVLKSQTSGELVDDKTYLMERIIQVCCMRHGIPNVADIVAIIACQRPSPSLEEPGRIDQCFPGSTLEFIAAPSAFVHGR